MTGADWSPDGYHIVTCSQDNSCKVWDLRKRNIEYTIPAHTNLVSNVKFERSSGEYLISSSYDNTARLWAAKTWLPLATLQVGFCLFQIGASTYNLCSRVTITNCQDVTFLMTGR